jgi:hypothetical protein
MGMLAIDRVVTVGNGMVAGSVKAPIVRYKLLPALVVEVNIGCTYGRQMDENDLISENSPLGMRRVVSRKRIDLIGQGAGFDAIRAISGTNSIARVTP